MKLKKTNCLICDRDTTKYIYICDDCYLLFDKKVEKVVKEFKYVDFAYGCFYYNPLMKELITKYKFGNKRYLSKLFSEQMIEKIFKENLHKTCDLTISVPIHKDTKKERGFNQIELIEKYINEITKITPSINNLIKTKLTKEQARLRESERYNNLKDAFLILRPDEIKDKSILLLDDMITTGQTIEECSKELKENGAKKVMAISIATTT